MTLPKQDRIMASAGQETKTSPSKKPVAPSDKNTDCNDNADTTFVNANNPYSGVTNKSPEYKTAAQYACAVNGWLLQYYYWQSMAATVPYCILLNSIRQSNVNAFSSGTPDIRSGYPTRTVFVQNGQPETPNRRGRQYHIPPLWKRFAAEFVDFLILFVLKLLVTYVAIDFFDIIDLDKYDFETLKEDLINYRLVLQMTPEIVMLELIHRFVVCFFEAMCLHRGTISRGGATPGKSLLGLKVVSCKRIVDLGNGNVIVQPANDIGFAWALLRSFVKNFSLAFFFPICFAFFMFQHDRTAYDILCKCVVVEESSLAQN